MTDELHPQVLLDEGYVLAANREFFYPLGLALTAAGDRLYVQDHRDEVQPDPGPAA